jgi:hypothetical protein
MDSFSAIFTRVTDISFWVQAWAPVSSFLSDNFTWWYVMFALLGLLLIKYKSLLGRLSIGYIVGLIVYIIIVSGKIQGHTYYWYIILHMICILSAYFIYGIGLILKKLIKIKYIALLSLVLILITIPAVNDSTNRMFDTNFYGQDMVGKYLLDNKEPNSRLFAFATSQTYAVCTYAKMYCGEPKNESDMIELEKKYNIEYLYIDVYRMQTIESSNVWNYTINNYHISYVGMVPYNNQLVPYGIVLKKGGMLNFNDISNQTPVLVTTYKSKGGEIPYYEIKEKED